MHHLVVDVPHLGLGQNLGLELPGVGGRDHIHPVIAVDIHKAQGAEAVEPNIGHPLNDLFRTGSRDRLFEFFDGVKAFPAGGAVFSKHQLQLGGDLLQQTAPGELGEFF